MPDVDFSGEHSGQILLTLALLKQAKALWRDMDSSDYRVRRRGKVADGENDDDESDRGSDGSSRS